ncbi:MAG: DUF4136 domain-containing protein [Pseudomonadota bacterium]
MRIRKVAAAVALSVAAIGLSACATGLNTQVSRYQAMPAPQGQTFAIVPGEGMAAMGGLEFQRYAAIVAQQLAARGYQPASGPQSASLIVQLGYSVSPGSSRVVGGGYPRGFYDPFLYGGFGHGFGHYPYGFGWNDPFWYGGGVSSYVEYQSELDLHIRAAGTNQALFDGRALARSTTNRLDVVIPSLVDAMFVGFPGRNGETVRITIPPRPVAPRY